MSQLHNTLVNIAKENERYFELTEKLDIKFYSDINDFVGGYKDELTKEIVSKLSKDELALIKTVRFNTLDSELHIKYSGELGNYIENVIEGDVKPDDVNIEAFTI